jgi:hypothetical protein
VVQVVSSGLTGANSSSGSSGLSEQKRGGGGTIRFKWVEVEHQVINGANGSEQ